MFLSTAGRASPNSPLRVVRSIKVGPYPWGVVVAPF
jgi:hypothetical protein